jgi:hypothetical protein
MQASKSDFASTPDRCRCVRSKPAKRRPLLLKRRPLLHLDLRQNTIAANKITGVDRSLNLLPQCLDFCIIPGLRRAGRFQIIEVLSDLDQLCTSRSGGMFFSPTMSSAARI